LGARKEVRVIAAPALQCVTSAPAKEESLAVRVFRRIAAAALVSLARIVIGAEARWIGCVPTDPRRIYIANHTSHADFILVWAALAPHLRSRTRPVAAADYWAHGKARRYLAEQVFRAVLVERNRVDRTHNPLARMLEALDQGNSLIVFPEGTRGGGETLQQFKCGIYHLAHARPNVELVPVWIDNLHRVLPKGTILPAPLLCSVTFGEPTRLLPGEDKRAFLERLHRIVNGLGELCATKNS
jgi:1-acyl-sn-glycerol-3-phosphate acyltransferase